MLGRAHCAAVGSSLTWGEVAKLDWMIPGQVWLSEAFGKPHLADCLPWAHGVSSIGVEVLLCTKESIYFPAASSACPRPTKYLTLKMLWMPPAGGLCHLHSQGGVAEAQTS